MYKVLILMGSESDRDTVESSRPYFEFFNIEADYQISSAHRNPERTAKLAFSARANGYSAIICAAGMAAHLAGVCVSKSDLPVIGVPLKGGMLDGLDALLSTVQMPKGVPVATFAVGKHGCINAAVFSARMISLNDEAVKNQLTKFINNGCVIPKQ